jgi:hypothetical protein
MKQDQRVKRKKVEGIKWHKGQGKRHKVKARIANPLP